MSERTVAKWVRRFRQVGIAGLEDGSSRPGAPAHQTPVPRRFIGERISVGSRGLARKAIIVVQAAQNRRRDHLSPFGEAMTGGHELVAFEQWIGNPGSEAGVWPTPVIVGHPCAKDQSKMSLVDRDQPVQTLDVSCRSVFRNTRWPAVFTRGSRHMPSHRRIARSTVAAKMLSRS